MTRVVLHEYCDEARKWIESHAYEQAIAICRHVLKRYPKHVEAYRLLGEACLEKGELAEATDVFQRLLSADPENFVAYAGLGVIYEERQQLAEAIWHMERAFELVPNNEEIRNALRRLYGRRDGTEPTRIKLNRVALARLYSRGGQYRQAIDEFNRTLELEPGRMDIKVSLLETLWRDGRREQAAELARDILRISPDCLKAILLLGTIQIEKGRTEEGRALLAQARTVDPENRLAQALFGDRSPLPPEEVKMPRLEGPPPPARTVEPGGEPPGEEEDEFGVPESEEPLTPDTPAEAPPVETAEPAALASPEQAVAPHEVPLTAPEVPPETAPVETVEPSVTPPVAEPTPLVEAETAPVAPFEAAPVETVEPSVTPPVAEPTPLVEAETAPVETVEPSVTPPVAEPTPLVEAEPTPAAAFESATEAIIEPSAAPATVEAAEALAPAVETATPPGTSIPEPALPMEAAPVEPMTQQAKVASTPEAPAKPEPQATSQPFVATQVTEAAAENAAPPIAEVTPTTEALAEATAVAAAPVEVPSIEKKVPEATPLEVETALESEGRATVVEPVAVQAAPPEESGVTPVPEAMVSPAELPGPVSGPSSYAEAPSAAATQRDALPAETTVTGRSIELEHFQAQLQQNPKDDSTRLSLARVYRDQEQIEQALEQYRVLTRAKPEVLSEAIVDMESIVASRPGNLAAHELLADLYTKNGQLQKALERYRWLLQQFEQKSE